MTNSKITSLDYVLAAAPIPYFGEKAFYKILLKEEKKLEDNSMFLNSLEKTLFTASNTFLVRGLSYSLTGLIAYHLFK